MTCVRYEKESEYNENKNDNENESGETRYKGQVPNGTEVTGYKGQ